MGHIGLTPQIGHRARRLQGAGPDGRAGTQARRGRARARGRRLLRARARGGPRGGRRGGDPDALDPDDRDRRRPRVRRPGARLARPARALRGPLAAVRQALRRRRLRDQPRAGGLRRGRPHRTLPGGPAHLRDAPRRSWKPSSRRGRNESFIVRFRWPCLPSESAGPVPPRKARSCWPWSGCSSSRPWPASSSGAEAPRTTTRRPPPRPRRTEETTGESATTEAATTEATETEGGTAARTPTVPPSLPSAGCGGCHTFAPANSSGTVGPTSTTST